jgi:hypothetical protein
MVRFGRQNPLDVVGAANSADGNAVSALRAAGLDFNVVKSPLLHPVTGREVNGRFMLTREDTGELVNSDVVVTNQYEILQNRDFFSDVADTMVAESGASISRCHQSGSKIYMLLEWPKSQAISVLGDIVSKRCVITNGFGGTAAWINLMPLRLACLNGMVVPDSIMKFVLKLVHKSSAPQRVATAARICGKAGKIFDTYGQALNVMAETNVSDNKAQEILKRVDVFGKDSRAAKNKLEAVSDLWRGGMVGKTASNAYDLWQAGIEYADYYSGIRITKGSSESNQRFKAAMPGGSGYRVKLDLYNQIVDDPDLRIGERIAALVSAN